MFARKAIPLCVKGATKTLLTALFVVMASASSLFAQTTYFWDNNSTTAGFGTAGGTWDNTASSLWSTSPTGELAPGAATTFLDSLNFGNGALGLAAGTITVSGTVDAGSLTFASGSGAIVLSGGTINLAAASSITVNNTTNTIGSIISGAGTSFTKNGAGILILSGANTFTGTTIINAGTLQVGDGTTGSLNGIIGTPLTFTGTGTFNVAGPDGNTQGMGALTLSGGDANITSTASSATSIATITLASLSSRPVGTTVNFSLVTNTSSTSATPNRIVVSGTNIIPLDSGSNNPGIFFGGTNYARYDAAGFVRNVLYGVDTNANGVLSGNAVITLGTTTAVTDSRFAGGNRTTTTSGAISGTNTNTLLVTDGTLFAVGQVITGTNIRSNSYITAISGNTLTLANAASVNAIGTPAVAAGTVLTPYNSVTGQTTATVNTINFLNTASSLTLVPGATLSVNGILKSGGNNHGVISGGTGIQVVNSGGELVIRTNAIADILTIATPILNNGGSSLTKSGAGTLLLPSASTFTGGTVINAGTVHIGNAASLGTNPNVVINNPARINANGSVTYPYAIAVNAPLTLQNPATIAGTSTATFTGILSGSSDITLPNSGVNAIQGILAFTNTANTFTGNVILSAANSGDEFFSFASLGDGGNFTFAKNGNRQGITYTGASNITFNTRQIVVATTMVSGGTTDRQGMDGGGANPVNLFANNGTGTVTFNTNMVVNTISSAYGVLHFGGTNTGNNIFAGTISDPSGTISTLGIGKFDTGKWILSGANTYEAMAIIGRGTLEVPTIANATTAQPLGVNLAFQLGRGSDSGALSYTGGVSSTNKQVFIGSPINGTAGTGGGSILNNGSGALTFTNATFNPLSTAYTNPTSGAVTGIAPTATRTLTLGGTFTGGNNEIQGVIQNNATSGGLVALTVSGSNWLLSGTNTYTGGTNIISGSLGIGNNSAVGTGTLNIGGTNSNTPTVFAFGAPRTIVNNTVLLQTSLGGNPTITGTQNLTINGTTTASGAARTLSVNNSGLTTLAGNIFLSDDNTTSGRGLTINGTGNTVVSGIVANNNVGNTLAATVTKAGNGTLTLGAANTYTGTTTVSAGTLRVNNTTGSGTGTGNVTVASLGTLGGTGFIVPASDNNVTVNGTIAPGNSSGTIRITVSGTGTVAIPGTYAFELSTAGSSAAVNTGNSSPSLPHTNHDVLSITGALDLTGSTLTITSLGSTGIVNTNSYSWLIASASGGITGTPTLGTVSSADFIAYQNDGGIFSLTTLGNDVFLNASPVPEPGIILGLSAAGLGLVSWVRRRRVSTTST